MKLSEIENKAEWGEISQSNSNAEFLQSYDWGEFQQAVGNHVLRLAFLNGDKLQGFVHEIGLGWKYAYFPRVVIKEDVSRDLIEYLKTKSIFFVRIESTIFFEPKSESNKIVQTRNRQPETTLIVDLQKNNEELLAAMHSKTRYNINLAEKKGVIVKKEKNADVFWNLNKETTGRDAFKSHGREYYEKMLGMEMTAQLTAYFDGVPIASNICVNYGGVFTYLHGASSNKFRNVMAPYLLQWHGIQLAKEIGCVVYDFWGIAPIQEKNAMGQASYYNNFYWDANHHWSGVTRFKVGFGGAVKKYPRAFEIPLKEGKYKLFNFVKKIKS